MSESDKLYISIDPGIASTAIVSMTEDHKLLATTIKTSPVSETNSLLDRINLICLEVEKFLGLCLIEDDNAFWLPEKLHVIIEDYEARPTAKSIRGSRTMAVLGALIHLCGGLNPDEMQIVKYRHWTKNYSLLKANCIAEKDKKVLEILDMEQELEDEHQVDAFRMLIGTVGIGDPGGGE